MSDAAFDVLLDIRTILKTIDERLERLERKVKA